MKRMADPRALFMGLKVTSSEIAQRSRSAPILQKAGGLLAMEYGSKQQE